MGCTAARKAKAVTVPTVLIMFLYKVYHELNCLISKIYFHDIEFHSSMGD